MKSKVAITLSGGGARGAYEAGVLRAIAELGKFKHCPFDIITGVSAGAINGMAIATQAEDFDLATKTLWDTWEKIRVENVFKTDSLSLFKTGATWLVDCSIGQWIGGSDVTHLLDTAPLFKFLKKRIKPEAITQNISKGYLKAISLSATDYNTGRLVTFFEGSKEIQPWSEISSMGVREKLTTTHVMASTAIPIFFPPVRLGDNEYGDGGIGLRSPLSDAIHLGADKIFVIGLKYSPSDQAASRGKYARVTLGDIAGAVLNSLFLNSLDSDLGRLEETNRLLRSTKTETARDIPSLLIQPSVDLGSIDTGHFARLPYPLRHLLKGLGVTQKKGWGLLSYLAFEPGYTRALLDLGYKDAMAMEDEILRFLTADQRR